MDEIESAVWTELETWLETRAIRLDLNVLADSEMFQDLVSSVAEAVRPELFTNNLKDRG